MAPKKRTVGIKRKRKAASPPPAPMLSADTEEEMKVLLARWRTPGHEVILREAKERAAILPDAAAHFGVTMTRPDLEKKRWTRQPRGHSAYLCVGLPAPLDDREQEPDHTGQPVGESTERGFFVTCRRKGVLNDPRHWRKYMGWPTVGGRLGRCWWAFDVDLTLDLYRMTAPAYLTTLLPTMPAVLLNMIVSYIRSSCKCC